mmetsp:Transcript_18805/g.52283  ORF Transcript_18805/g.52283 Transcript_18805/m.52283 type:complete len:239 (-) Transcript_18805:182-898(-)|eukprot:CAMPEP_0198118026 /NCGR_PEP_ID=MMETSP1442-20131203/20077_1 /TAXON_ID= /ORGANISM="Craspedostauros australis, Strain CCMP3328" /LENGTH=238 /DNA_ID=CAMNT_0043776203 /DNA_START=364 /DNA_END=1080 /DNA_ORIENTATION=+
MEQLTKLNASPVLLSNVELLELLSKRIEDRGKEEARRNSNRRRRNQSTKYMHRDWIEQSVCDYLRKTPCAGLDMHKHKEMKRVLMKRGPKSSSAKSSSAAPSSSSSTAETSAKQSDSADAAESNGFNLTEAESIQIINFLPRQPVDIHLMIEELQNRMSETRQEQLLEFIASYAPEQDQGDVVMESNDNGNDDDDDVVESEAVKSGGNLNGADAQAGKAAMADGQTQRRTSKRVKVEL